MKLGRKYQLNESSIRKWVAKYKTFGENAFMIRSANLNYSAAFKEEVVKAYLHGEGSYKDIAIKYKIQAATTVLQWIKRYNNHEELKDSRPEGVYHMVKNNPARKTTLEERLSIVEYCIEHDDNYSLTAGQYNCSYAQVRSWVLSKHNDNPLVYDTFDAALATNPGAQPIFHSDRGYQYTSKVFRQKILEAGMTQSMSRVAHCTDNGPMEGFWGIMKREMYYGKKYKTKDDLLRSIEEYIDYYTNRRVQRKLNLLTPMEYHERLKSAA